MVVSSTDRVPAAVVLTVTLIAEFSITPTWFARNVGGCEPGFSMVRKYAHSDSPAMVTVNALPRTTESLFDVMPTAFEATSKVTVLVLYSVPRPAAVGQTPLAV
ncbi:hypothetical protein DSECCO2_500070 [anaerobic digester metagenome]